MEERRLVSVLFCDVVGSTALAAQLDPEEWAEIIRAAFPHLIEPVERYGGAVARLMGDGILAFFGAPAAHADDAQRAVLAGLGILEGIRSLREEVRREYGFDLNVRVGINTGIVVVGAFGTERTFEYTAMGDAVNVAARMEQTATPGTVQVTADTYAHVYPHFTFETLAPLSIKGKDKPVEAYRVTGRAADPGRRLGDLGAPLIGRERELEVLKEKLTDLQHGRGGVVALVGNAGLGKSRLLDEVRRLGGFVVDCVPTAGWIEDRRVSYETSTPYSLIRRRICEGLQLSEDATSDVVRAQVASVLPALTSGDHERAVRTINLLFSVRADRRTGGNAADRNRSIETPFDGDEFRHELAELVELVWRTWIDACGAGVYVVDDFQHTDTASLEILEPVLDAVCDLPLLVMLAFRLDNQSFVSSLHRRMLERDPLRYVTIELMPLDIEHTERLVDALLTGTQLPDEIRTALLDRVDGNPLFAEEIVRSLIGQGIVVVQRELGGTVMRLGSQAEHALITIPTNLQSLLRERMDWLPAQARQTLQIAAVLGRTFEYDAIAAIVEDPSRLDADLITLQDAMFIRGVASAQTGEYSFHHALTWEAAYEAILYRHRRGLHHRVGEALEQLHAGHAEAYAGLIGFHFFNARDRRAIVYASMAGQRALSLYAHAEAIMHFGRAIDVAQQFQERPPLDVLEGRGVAYQRQANYELARDDFLAALAVAKQSREPRSERQLLLHIGETWEGNDYAQVGEWYAAALDRAKSASDDLLVARSLVRLGNWHGNNERIDEARANLEEALRIFQIHDDKQGVAQTLDQLATIADFRGDLVGMLSGFRQAAALFEELGDQLRLSSALANIGQCWGLPVFFANTIAADISEVEALDALDRAIAIAESTGWRSGQAYAELALGSVHDIRGRLHLARVHIDRGLAIAEEVQHNEWSSLGHLVRGWHHLLLLDPDNAITAIEQALDYARKARSGHFINLTLAGLAEALIAAGELEQAARTLQQQPEDLTFHTVSARVVWRSRTALALAQGDPQRALWINDALIDTDVNYSGLAGAPMLAAQRGEALYALGRLDDARTALEAALRGLEARGIRANVWRLHCALRGAHLDAGDLDKAGEALDGARAALNALAMSISDESKRDAFLARAERETARDGTSTDVSIAAPGATDRG